MSTPLQSRLKQVGLRLGAREADHREGLGEARKRAEKLHAQVCEALEFFHTGAREVGAPHLHIETSEPRLDDKHVRSVEFEIARGRHRAIVTVKSRGEVTLVGPFKAGKVEGPCQTFPFDEEAEIEGALGDFLERFLEEAATP